MAFAAMRTNKVRAAATILGVALAVFVLVAMSAGIHGVGKSVARDLASAGPTSFYVYPVPRAVAERCAGTEASCPQRDEPPLTLEDAAAISRLESVETVAAHVATSVTVKYENHLRRVRLDAYTPDWVDVDGGDIYPGRSFTAAEHDTGARVVIIDERLARQLGRASGARHESIEIDGVQFAVIGMYHYSARIRGRPGSLPTGDAPKVIVPLTTAHRALRTNLRWLDLTVKPRPAASRAEALDDVTSLLRTRRGLGHTAQPAFAVVTPDRLLEVYDGFLDGFSLIMIALVTVGLVAGGVGVVAILMTSVAERTREIGLRKALGATSPVILWLFLVEAATLTSVGAVAGLAAASVTAPIVDRFSGIPTSVTPGAIVAALGASAMTGLLFGMLPAARAARLPAIDALRYE